MDSQENKLLIKIGKSFEATASGKIAILAVVAIIGALISVQFTLF